MRIKNKIKKIDKRYLSDFLREAKVNAEEAVKSLNLFFNKEPRKLKHLCLDPLYNCPLSCETCRCGFVSKSFPSNKLLTTQETRNIIDQFSKIGGRTFSIVGGEPLLRKDIYQIIKSAKEKKLKVKMHTNGILLNQKRSLLLIKSGLDHLIFSIDGVDKIYELIRGRGNFPKLLNALTAFFNIKKSLPAKKPHTEFAVTVSRKNATNLKDVLFLAKRFGIKRVSFNYVSRIPETENLQTQKILKAHFNKKINHWSLPKEVLVTKKQLNKVKKEAKNIKILAEKLNIDCNISPEIINASPSLLTGRFSNLRKRCNYLWNSLIIEPDGRIAPCPMLTHWPTGNIRKQSLKDYWQNNKKLKNIRRILLRKKYLPICFFCCNREKLL